MWLTVFRYIFYLKAFTLLCKNSVQVQSYCFGQCRLTMFVNTRKCLHSETMLKTVIIWTASAVNNINKWWEIFSDFARLIYQTLKPIDLKLIKLHSILVIHYYCYFIENIILQKLVFSSDNTTYIKCIQFIIFSSIM